MRAEPLVSTDWLEDRLGSPGIKVLDATFFLPGQGDARAEHLKAHIPGAAFFDIETVADPDTSLPHMLPSAEAFAAAVGGLGVGDGDHVVVYGTGASRVWWSFRVMGHDRVSVLDGGLAKWRNEGRPVESGAVTPAPAVFTPKRRPELMADLGQMRERLADQRQVADARSGERFRGEAPEPRPGLRSGHMPGAVSLPSSTLFAADGTLRSPPELAELLRQAGVDLDQPLTATCGSGVTAAMIALALARLGRWETSVYDGSWSEWGSREDTQVTIGPE